MRKHTKETLEEYCEKEQKGKSTEKVCRSNLKSAIHYAEKIGVNLADWDENITKEWLKEIHSISAYSLRGISNYFRGYYRFLTGKDILLDAETFYELTDYEKLMETVLSEKEYQFILSELKKNPNNNIRDILIYELGWLGLSSEQVSNLKRTDIKFMWNDIGKKQALLEVRGNSFLVTDEELINDIEQCMHTTDYYIDNRKRERKNVGLKDTEYLIKPANMGVKGEKNGKIISLQIVLSRLMKQNPISCAGIKPENLNLEALRRSKIIYLLGGENKFTVRQIQEKFKLESGTPIYICWRLCRKKYNK